MFGNLGLSKSKKNASSKSPDTAQASSLAAQAAAITFNKSSNSNPNSNGNSASHQKSSLVSRLNGRSPSYQSPTVAASDSEQRNEHSPKKYASPAPKNIPQHQQKQHKPLRQQLSPDQLLSQKQYIRQSYQQPFLENKHTLHTTAQPSQQRSSRGATPIKIQVKKRYSDFGVSAPHATYGNVTSSPSGLQKPLGGNDGPRSKLFTRHSTFDIRRPISNEKKKLLPALNTTDLRIGNESEPSSSTSFTAMAAAALAAKKVSEASDSRGAGNNHNGQAKKSALTNTGFLQPPSSDAMKLKPPSSPALSNRSIVSANSDLCYSPGGLSVIRKPSFDYFRSTESFNPQSDNEGNHTFPFGNDYYLRSKSVDDRRQQQSGRLSQHKTDGKKIILGLERNKSFASLSDNRSFSVGSSDNLLLLGKHNVRSVSPPIFLKHTTINSQDGINNNSPIGNKPYSNPSLLNLSQASLPYTNIYAPKAKLNSQIPILQKNSSDNSSSSKTKKDVFQVPLKPASTNKRKLFSDSPSRQFSKVTSHANSSKASVGSGQPRGSNQSARKLSVPSVSSRAQSSEFQTQQFVADSKESQQYDKWYSENEKSDFNGQPDNASIYSSAPESTDYFEDPRLVNYETSPNYPYHHNGPSEQYAEHNVVQDSESEGLVLDHGQLPQYPLSVPGRYKSHPSKSARHAFKKKGKKVLRDLGFSSDPKTKHHGQNLPTMTKNQELGIGATQKPVEFRKTMRKEKKKHLNFNEDKPWKHHNDSLVVSEAEKKRYEGVWVANRGLYMNLMRTPINNPDGQPILPSTDGRSINATSSSHSQDINHPSQLVHGYVVRSLWRRSKLSDEILSKIWSLVDLRKDGTLNRDEFVVGMWLVDQCLYGRKLPKTLDENVWSSVKKLVVQVAIKQKKNKFLK